MEKHTYWSIIPVAGSKAEILKSVKEKLKPFIKEIIGRSKFELSDGEEGLDDDEISDVIHTLFDGPMYWGDFDEIPTQTEIMDIFMPYLTVNTDGFFIRQYMDTASLPDNTSFLFLSSDSEEEEERGHCEILEFLSSVLAPLMVSKYSVGGWMSLSSSQLIDAGSYAFSKDGTEIPIQKMADKYFSIK